ncbi:hypothetical protein C8R43DRAFT_1108252 [Mycena crocata]|nr:hypothetical protein C8R43DRAFT_1108252 [Mycena crocata]
MDSLPTSQNDKIIVVSDDMKDTLYSHESLKAGEVEIMKPYLIYFGLDGKDSAGGVGTETAVVFGMYTIGTCLAVLAAGPVSDPFGRRGGMVTLKTALGNKSHIAHDFQAVGGFFCVASGIVVTAARDVKYLKGGRISFGYQHRSVGGSRADVRCRNVTSSVVSGADPECAYQIKPSANQCKQTSWALQFPCDCNSGKRHKRNGDNIDRLIKYLGLVEGAIFIADNSSYHCC